MKLHRHEAIGVSDFRVFELVRFNPENAVFQKFILKTIVNIVVYFFLIETSKIIDKMPH